MLIAASLFRDRLSDRAILCAAVLFAVGIPFFLPHMHDRYFFAADILTLVLAFAIPWVLPVAPLTQFASLLGYHAYIYMRFLLPMRYGSWSLIAVLALTAAGGEPAQEVTGAGAVIEEYLTENKIKINH